MDRGRKRLPSSFARASALGGAADRLSSVARGGEWQGGDATACGDIRRDNLAALCGNGANHCKVCAYSRSETGDCYFRDRGVDAACAPKRWWRATSFGKSLSRAIVGCPNSDLTPPPAFFVSVADKGLSVGVSGLESTLPGWLVSVDSKRACRR